MMGRRLLLLVAVLMGLTALAASIAPREPSSPGPTAAPGRPPLQPTQTPAQAAEPAAPAPDDVVDETVSAVQGASPTRVRAQVGQTLRLQVQGPVLDEVEIQGLDLVKAIAPEAPAVIEIYVDRPGRFPITLGEANRQLGEIVVKE